MRRIGVLMFYSESDNEGRIRAKAFEEGSQKLGWTKDRNVRFEYRWGNSFQQHATDLVKLRVDAIITVSTPALIAVQRQTQTTPIVFTQVFFHRRSGNCQEHGAPGRKYHRIYQKSLSEKSPAVVNGSNC